MSQIKVILRDYHRLPLSPSVMFVDGTGFHWLPRWAPIWNILSVQKTYLHLPGHVKPSEPTKCLSKSGNTTPTFPLIHDSTAYAALLDFKHVSSLFSYMKEKILACGQSPLPRKRQGRRATLPNTAQRHACDKVGKAKCRRTCQVGDSGISLVHITPVMAMILWWEQFKNVQKNSFLLPRSQ